MRAVTNPQATSQGLKPIRAFKAGRRTDSAGHVKDWSAADLQELAESYDPQLREAPITIGHPKDNAPAYGWIGSLKTDGQVLDAMPRVAQPEFQDWVGRELFKQISVSIYGREHPNNPTPGRLYLRHVGFLGAQPPAIAGLSHSFADGDDAGELLEFTDFTVATTARLFRGLRDWFIGKFGQEEADKALASWDVQALAEDAVRDPNPTAPASCGPCFAEDEGDPSMPQQQAASAADLATREAALADAQRKLGEDRAALARREAEMAHGTRMASFSDFAESLVKEGRLLPRDKAALVHVMGALPEATVLEFGDGDGAVKKPAVEVLQSFLKGLPKAVHFGEHAGAASTADDQVDATDAGALAKAAIDFKEAEHKAGRVISIEAAVQHVRDLQEA